LSAFSRLGINESLIYNADADVDRYLDTAWSMQAVRGVALAAIVLVAAPFIADVFGDPRATDVLRVIAVSPLLTGFRNPGVVYFRKHLEFHKEFVYKLSGSLLNFLVAIGIALLIVRSVWALVAGYVVADATRLLASYALHDHRPRPVFDIGLAGEMFSYGKWITGQGIVQFLITEGDDAVVGILLSSAALGFYTTAYRIAKAPATEITQIISSVMFPTYSKLQDDVDELRDAFFRTVKLVTFLSFPVGIGIAVVAPTFVRAFMGTEWLPMVRTMQFVAFYGILVSWMATFGPVWKAIGRPDYAPKLGALRLVVMAAFILPAVRQYGIEGAAMVVLGVYIFLNAPLNLYLVSTSVDTTVRRLLAAVSYPAAASAAMGATVLLIRRTVALGAPVLEFVLLVATGAASYLIAVAILELRFGWGIERNVRQVLDAVRG
jgi:PST family polysaccharide transporter/lipopolysaccharide exporter